MTVSEVIRWWEIRRILYNAVLFAIGILSILGMEWLMGKVIPIGNDAVEPFALALGVVIYGVIANLCYTAGWIVELAIRKGNEDRARTIAKKLFLVGLWFSGLLTSTPFWFGLVFFLVHRKS